MTDWQLTTRGVVSSYSQFRCRSCCTCRTEDWPDTPPPARTSWRSSEERLEVPSGPVNGLTSSLYRGFTLTFGSGKNIPHLKDFLDRRLSVNSSDKMVYYLISTLDFLLSEITKFSASSIFLSRAATWAVAMMSTTAVPTSNMVKFVAWLVLPHRDSTCNGRWYCRASSFKQGDKRIIHGA